MYMLPFEWLLIYWRAIQICEIIWQMTASNLTHLISPCSSLFQGFGKANNPDLFESRHGALFSTPTCDNTKRKDYYVSASDRSLIRIYMNSASSQWWTLWLNQDIPRPRWYEVPQKENNMKPKDLYTTRLMYLNANHWSLSGKHQVLQCPRKQRPNFLCKSQAATHAKTSWSRSPRRKKPRLVTFILGRNVDMMKQNKGRTENACRSVLSANKNNENASISLSF